MHNMIPYISTLQCDTEYSDIFRSARDHHQGTKAVAYKIILATVIHALLGVKGSVS